MLKKTVALVLLTGLLFITACANKTDTTNLDALYKSAIADSKIAKHDEISRTLIAISSPENTNTPPLLKWKKIGGEQYVLVSTWAGKYISDKNWKAGEKRKLNKTTNIWVTAFPELQNFFKKNQFWPATHEARILRIEQLLGLPKGDGNTRFIEFWVKPIDIFRPSADPDPSDHEAQLEHPWKRSKFQKMDTSHKIYEYINPENPNREYTYEGWFKNLNATSYTANPPYPWTRLGYTYDWSNDRHNNNHVGLSEFIVKGGATIFIERTIDTQNLEHYFVTP